MTDRGKLVKQAWGKFHDSQGAQHTAMVSMYEFSPNYFTVYLDRTQPSLPIREGQVMGGTRALAEERYGHFVAGQSQRNPNERNLRNKFIATIQRNRMNAEKLGHKGVRPVSESDLRELHNMTTADLEQTAKLTWQLTQPVQPQEWQPHAENLTELTARDYATHYREQGYEVNVVPSKRYVGKFDMYVRRK